MKLFALAVMVTLWSACSTNLPDSNLNELAGMYKLHIIENLDSTGAWHEQEWASGGTGYIVYDGKGHMAVQITPNGYKDFGWLTEEETINKKLLHQKIDSMPVAALKAAVEEFSSNYVYVANYTINDSAGIVEHHRLSHSIPSAWNTNVKRQFTFDGDTLILKVLDANRRLKWIKQK
ncbi:MAG: lipocalin-like domain-containing protein [Chitinophagales bacterium]